MKKSILFLCMCAGVGLFSACNSPVKRAVVHETTGLGKGPVEKAGDKAEKKVKHAKKDLEKKVPDMERDK